MVAAFIVATASNHFKEKVEEETGAWALDVLEPWALFKREGMDVTLASPGGNKVPFDPRSLPALSPEAKALLDDESVLAQLAAPTSLSRVAPAPATERMLAYVAGGHGALFDLHNNATLAEFLENTASTGAVIGACSHGTCALLRMNGGDYVKGRKWRGAWHIASQSGHVLCVRQILREKGKYKLTAAEASAADAGGRTPLHYAALFGRAEICGVLCAAGARRDAVDLDAHTPLMYAQLRHPSNTALLDVLAGRGPAHAPSTVCDECGTSDSQARLSTCTGCLVTRYCGSACSAAAWPAHKAECRRVQAAREERSRGTTTIV